MFKTEHSLKWALIVLLLGGAFSVLLPVILTRNAFWYGFDFSQTGQIGDTIGGITAPLVNLVGAVLVYFALQAQVDANKTVQSQIVAQQEKESIENESKEIHQLYGYLKDSIDNFRYSTLDPYAFGEKGALIGSEGIFKLFQDFYCDYHLNEEAINFNPKITEIISMLEICDTILQKLSISIIPDMNTMRILTVHQFQYRIAPRLNQDGANLKKYHCDFCSAEHGLPDRIVSLIESINSHKFN